MLFGNLETLCAGSDACVHSPIRQVASFLNCIDA